MREREREIFMCSIFGTSQQKWFFIKFLIKINANVNKFGLINGQVFKKHQNIN